MNSKSKSILSLLIVSALAGCGGGGDGQVDNTPTFVSNAGSRAEGIYEGTASDGSVFETVILENDEFWMISGRLQGQMIGVSSVLTGQGKSVSGSFVSSDVREYDALGFSRAGSLTSSYLVGKSWSGSIYRGNQVVSFTGALPANTSFSYNTPASLASIAGSWSGETLDRAVGSISVSPTGALTGSLSGCQISGTIQPRASGKNVFDVAFKFGAAPCLAPGQSVAGIAVSYVLDSAKRQLIVSGVTADKTRGSVFLAVR